MISRKEMIFVYGDLSTSSNRLASRFNVVQEWVRRCTEGEPCNLSQCPPCLRRKLFRERREVRSWFQKHKHFDLQRIILRVPFLVRGKNLDSTFEKLRPQITKLLQGKKVWNSTLRGYVLIIHVDVIAPREGSKFSRFQISIYLIACCRQVAPLELATRWHRLLGAAGVPRRAPRSTLVEVEPLGVNIKKVVQWLVPTSSALLGCMPSNPFSASPYLEVLPQLSKVLVAPRHGDGG